jgi:hypothetical protein
MEPHTLKYHLFHLVSQDIIRLRVMTHSPYFWLQVHRALVAVPNPCNG